MTHTIHYKGLDQSQSWTLSINLFIFGSRKWLVSYIDICAQKQTSKVETHVLSGLSISHTTHTTSGKLYPMCGRTDQNMLFIKNNTILWYIRKSPKKGNFSSVLIRICIQSLEVANNLLHSLWAINHLISAKGWIA